MDLLPDFSTFLVTVGVVGATLYFLRRILTRKRLCSRVFLHGKTVIITGINSVSGKETARELARRGARVILACSNEKYGREVANAIERDSRGEIGVRKLDLASFKSIRQFAEEILASERRVDILINNAEIICRKKKTNDGFDMVFGVNHLGHFLLTQRLVDKMKASSPARIINVSSCVHEQGEMNWIDLNFGKTENYIPMAAYAQSKIANILFTRELARRLRGSGVNVYAAQPGAAMRSFLRTQSGTVPVASAMADYVLQFFGDIFKNDMQGAQTIIYCALAEELAHQSGLYYSDCKVKHISSKATDSEAAKKLWDISLKMTGLQN